MEPFPLDWDFSYVAHDENAPRTVADAMERSDWPEWKTAMKTELDSMMRLQVWKVQP